MILGLGRKFNLRELEQEDFEFAYILSRFMLIELDNIRYLAQIFEKKKLEHEMKIARDIQLSLLPQGAAAAEALRRVRHLRAHPGGGRRLL